MRHFIKSLLQFSMLFFLVIAIVSSCNSSGSSDKTSENVTQKDKDGFISLFDGKTLNGWEGDSSIWKVKDGIITGDEDSTSNLKANTF